MKNTAKPRIKTEWNLNLLVEEFSEQALQESIKKSELEYQNFYDKWFDNMESIQDPKTLVEALRDYQSLGDQSGFRGYATYVKLKYSKNQLDEDNQRLNNLIFQVEANLLNKVVFFTNRIAKTPIELQKKILADPTVSVFKNYLRIVYLQGQHQLNDESEQVFNLLTNTAYMNWSKMTKRLLSAESARIVSKDGSKQTKVLSELIDLTCEQDQKIRDSAKKLLNRIFKQYVEIGEFELNSILEFKKVDDQLRSFERPDESALLDGQIDAKFIDGLRSVVRANFDISHKFYELKAKVLGLEKLTYGDRNIRITLEEEENIKYEEAFDKVLQVLKGLDSEFAEIFQSYHSSGQVDVYPAKGKTHGAFCTFNPGNLPDFVLLNFNGKISDVFTLAHEFGHAFNHELVKRNQEKLNRQQSLAISEFASTLVEHNSMNYELEIANPRQKVELIFNLIGDFVASVFRQMSCYEFELELHHAFREEGYLTHRKISEIFKKCMSAYLGPSVIFESGEQNWWLYWQHIRYYFYVYSYASGYLTAIAVSSKLEHDKSFITQVKKLLSVGSSVSPFKAFSDIGIDLHATSFWQRGFDYIRAYLEELERLVVNLKIKV